MLLIQRLSAEDKVGDRIFALLLAINSLPHGCKISVFLPYLYYSRQDSALDLFLDLLQNARVQELITFDIHKEQNLPDWVKNLSVVDLLTMDADCIIRPIISPDIGGALRAQRLASKFGLPHLILEKTRNHSDISHKLPDNFMLGYKKAIIFDDIIDSGKTIFSAIELLQKAGFEEFEIIATHYLASSKLIFPKEVTKLTITDSIIHKKDLLPEIETIVTIHPTSLSLSLRGDLKIDAAISGSPD